MDNKIESISEFIEKLHACETWSDSHNLFKAVDHSILTAFCDSGERAKSFGFQLTMRDEFLLTQAKAHRECV